MNWLNLAFDRATWPKEQREDFYDSGLSIMDRFDDLLYEIYLPAVSKYMLADDPIFDWMEF